MIRLDYYGELVNDFPDLEKGEVYISHTGDGEYQFNVFNAVLVDKCKIWEKLTNHYNCKSSEFLIYRIPNWFGKGHDGWFICRKSGDFIFAVFCLTINKIDPDEYEIGG